MSIIVQYLIISLLSVLTGYGIYLLLIKLIPKKVLKENLAQKQEVLKEAKKQSTSILKGSNERLSETIQLMSEELEEDILSAEQELLDSEQDLKSQEENLEQEIARVEKLESDVKSRAEQKEHAVTDYEAKLLEIESSKRSLINKLEVTSNIDSEKQLSILKDNLIESRQLETQKVLKELVSDLDSSARKKAQRVLDRAHARYAPNFYWPKAINTVEVTSRQLAEKLADPECSLISDLAEISGVEISVNLSEDENYSSTVKLAGGFGIHKEAAKMAVNALMNKGPAGWKKAKLTYDTYNQALENEAAKLGREAVNKLKLPNIHPEVQRLIGALNWRTSYRQNQWFHTVEVGTLAGIIAAELGVDPAAARRVGLLHDIGKAIDYKIEGSHAVISGDYADRFGENKIICDTVMSHHSDIVIETPLAYVLRVADTLSGARPGARVNLEEGYQIRLSAIADAVRSFKGISDMAIMNGGREVHIQVNHKKVKENQLHELTQAIVKKIEEDVAFPGQIKVLVSRQFESVTVA